MITQQRPQDVAHGLWLDESVLDRQHEATARTIETIRRGLSDCGRRSEEEREFLRLLTWSRSIDSRHADRVFTDPRGSHWARLAGELFQVVHGDSDWTPAMAEGLISSRTESTSTAWAAHLQRFSLIAVAIAHHAGVSLSLNETPLSTPDVLPATPWSISNDRGPVFVSGIRNGKFLQLRVNGHMQCIELPDRSTDYEHGLTIHRAADVKVHGGRLSLQPHVFNVPRAGETRSVVAASPESQYGLVDEIESTLACIESYDPETFRQLAHYMRVIAFKAPEFGGAFSASCPVLPRAAVFTEARHPLVLAADFIVQFYRQRLGAIEEDFLCDGWVHPSSREECFYSPWEDNACGVHRLFQSTYAFERVLRFWLAVIRSNELCGIELEYAAFRSIALARQLEIALAQLLDCQALTEAGSLACGAISASVAAHVSSADSLGIPADTAAIVIESEGQFTRLIDRDGRILRVSDVIDQHIVKYDIHEKTRQIVERKLGRRSDQSWIPAAVA